MQQVSKEDILKKISALLIEDFECPAEKLTPEVRLFEDLDLDSIDAVDLIVRLQQYTGKKVDPASFKQIRTLGDVVDAVDKLLHQSDDSAA